MVLLFSSSDNAKRFKLFAISIEPMGDRQSFFASECTNPKQRPPSPHQANERTENSQMQEKKRLKPIKDPTFNQPNGHGNQDTPQNRAKNKKQRNHRSHHRHRKHGRRDSIKEGTLTPNPKRGGRREGPYPALVGVHLVASRHRDTAPGNRTPRTREEPAEPKRAPPEANKNLSFFLVN